MRSGIVTLTTDFGTADTFVGTVKGVILGRCPSARIVDLTHHVPPGDLVTAALGLRAAHPYFPPGTVHVVVVDPGVGSGREILASEAEGGIFLAPDSGILPAAFDPFGEGETSSAVFRAVDISRHALPEVSPTFHGRDVFAPAAASLAGGLPFDAIGPPLETPVRFTLPSPTRTGGKIRGEVLAVDRFGNLVTNLRERDLPEGPWDLHVGSRTLRGPGLTFSSVPSGEPVAYLGSGGFLEVAVRDGNARRFLDADRGSPLLLEVAS